MAISSSTYLATSGQTDFAITFPYIETTHVYVKVDGVDTAAFTVNTGTGNVVLDSGATTGQVVKVYRKTPGRTEAEAVRLVDFQDGSVLTEADLDKITLQLLYLSQEAQETSDGNLPIDFDGNYNAGGLRIKNIGEPVEEFDAVRKAYVDALSLYGQGIAVPQSWAFTGADLSGLTGQVTVELENPTPASSEDAMFLVSVDGYLQRPGTDFTVSVFGSTYTLTLFLDTNVIESDTVISVQNFGVARSVAPETGFVMPNIATPAIQARAIENAEVPVVTVADENDSVVASVDADGAIVATNLDVGSGSVAAASANIPSMTADNVAFSNTISVGGNITSGGNVTISGDLSVSGSLSGTFASGSTLIGTQYAAWDTYTLRQLSTATNGWGAAQANAAILPFGIDYTSPDQTAGKNRVIEVTINLSVLHFASGTVNLGLGWAIVPLTVIPTNQTTQRDMSTVDTTKVLYNGGTASYNSGKPLLYAAMFDYRTRSESNSEQWQYSTTNTVTIETTDTSGKYGLCVWKNTSVSLSLTIYRADISLKEFA